MAAFFIATEGVGGGRALLEGGAEGAGEGEGEGEGDVAPVRVSAMYVPTEDICALICCRVVVCALLCTAALRGVEEGGRVAFCASFSSLSRRSFSSKAFPFAWRSGGETGEEDRAGH